MGIFGSILKAALPIAGSIIPGVGTMAGAALGSAVAGGISGAENSAKAGKLSKQQNKIAMGNWNDAAPLRQRALQMALAPRAGREDTSALFADPGNPYSRQVPRPAAPPPPVAPPPVAGPTPTRARPPGLLGKAIGGNDTQRFAESHPLIKRILEKQSGPRIGPDGLVVR